MNRFLTLLLAASCLTAVGQCTADFDFGSEVTFGISPDPSLGESFAFGQYGLFYSDTLHILIPNSVSDFPGDIPISLPVDSVWIEDIVLTGEAGEALSIEDLNLTLTPNNNNDSGNPNTFLGGGQYCVALTGTPDTSGYFLASIPMRVWLNLFGSTFNDVLPFDGYNLQIYPESGAGPGCTDVTACNYNPFSESVDELCVFAEVGWDCAGNPIAPGCMVSDACNYDITAQTEDGSCVYTGAPCDDNNLYTVNDTIGADCLCLGDYYYVEGCLDENACNFNPEANAESYDIPCLFLGTNCSDPSDEYIFGYVTDDCVCQEIPTLHEILEARQDLSIFKELLFSLSGNELENLQFDLYYIGRTLFIPTDGAFQSFFDEADLTQIEFFESMSAFMHYARRIHMTSPMMFEPGLFSLETADQQIPSEINDGDIIQSDYPDSTHTITFGPNDAIWKINEASILEQDLVYRNGVIHIIDAVLFTNEFGCMDSEACNYSSEAQFEDNSCHYLCQVCLDGTTWSEELQGCVPESVACEVEFDFDGDGYVGSGDLLAFLTAFGASFPDEDADGVCDDIDECIGEYDECGVCNGPGAVYECGCADIPAGDCDCNGNVLDECDVCGGEGIADGACDCDGNVLGDCVAFLEAPALNPQGYSFTYGITNWSPLGFDWSNANAIQNVSFEFVPVDSTDFSEIFPNADFAQQVPVQTGGVNSSFFEYNPDYFGFWGGVDGTSGIQVVHPEAVEYLPYPFSEGDVHADQLTFEFIGGGLVNTRTFEINMEGVAAGTLQLPNGLSFDNALRVATRTLTTDSNATNVSTLLTEGFQYWTQDMPLPVALTYTYTQILGGDSSLLFSGGEFLVDILDYSEIDGGVISLSTGVETPSPMMDGVNRTSLPLGYQQSGMSVRCLKD